MCRHNVWKGIILALLVLTARVPGEGLRVLPERMEEGPAREMMQRYLFREVDAAWTKWREDYEGRTTSEAITAYQARLREGLRNAVGGFPERTPLQARVTGFLQRPAYRVEKVIFESQPGHHVTGNLFIPESEAYTAPYPGVLVPCGHYRAGKAAEEYQSMGALLAYHGMAAFVYDPIEQGERVQLEESLSGAKGHMMMGVGSILLGRNTATFEIWDGMRALDYLQSRPEVDRVRIGCTGNSGGGTQTSYLMALDDRISVAAPSCYHHLKHVHVRGPFGDAENAIFGQLAIPMEPTDYLMLRAPELKILMCTATEDFLDVEAAWTVFRYAKRLYSRLGFAERMMILENDAPHNYDKTQREGIVRWMARWLQDRDEILVEPPLDLFTEEELYCTPQGSVMDLEGARTTYDLNIAHESEWAAKRNARWANEEDWPARLDEVRAVAGIRRLEELPKPIIQLTGIMESDEYRMKKITLLLEEGIYLPALLYLPKGRQPQRVVVYVDEAGKGRVSEKVLEWIRQGCLVLAVDVRGTGDTAPPPQDRFPFLGLQYKDNYVAYLLSRSYVGMRAEDILTATRFASEFAGLEKALPVDLVALGRVGVPALHAAALESHLFQSILLENTLRSWKSVITDVRSFDQMENAVHGALRIYDLPNLAAALGDRLLPRNLIGNSS
jgi:cephalosporin-C deacetylase-like acetyl esterase